MVKSVLLLKQTKMIVFISQLLDEARYNAVKVDACRQADSMEDSSSHESE